MVQSSGKGGRRANGEGSIYKYRGGWRAALAYTDPDGTRRRRTVSGKSQAVVRRTLSALRADLDRGLTPPERTTVAEFLTGSAPNACGSHGAPPRQGVSGGRGTVGTHAVTVARSPAPPGGLGV